jgi:acetyl esterase/lipase
MRYVLLWVVLFSAYSFSAKGSEETRIIDAGFDFTLTSDIHYVTQKLDQVTTLQTLDVYRPNDIELAPVILYVHGGAWAFGDKKDVHVKPNYFTLNGFALVSMNYRLRWDYKIYDQVIDLVSAIRWIQENGAEFGLDADRIVMMGHGAGGHLVSLVMADSSYLRAEGISGKGVKVVVSIDSTSYDITRVMKELGSFVERRKHEVIFTSDEGVWRAASPQTHVSKNSSLPPFALLYNPVRHITTLQAKGFAKALIGAGGVLVMVPGSVSDPARTDELIGVSGNIATGALMAFIRSQL